MYLYIMKKIENYLFILFIVLIMSCNGTYMINGNGIIDYQIGYYNNLYNSYVPYPYYYYRNYYIYQRNYYNFPQQRTARPSGTSLPRRNTPTRQLTPITNGRGNR